MRQLSHQNILPYRLARLHCPCGSRPPAPPGQRYSAPARKVL
ncbi:hypothetical protein [Arthrobacter sp. DR-2P]|nr:hypothetical protein [Arthrobacter sp. DR-2P]